MRHNPGRVIGADLVNPYFVAYAYAFGGYAEVVETTDVFPGAFECARASKRPAILKLRTDPEALTPDQTMSEARDEKP